MFYLMAPPLIRREREIWLKNHIERYQFKTLLVESPHGERELARVNFEGEIIRYNEHNQKNDARKLAKDMRSYQPAGLLSDGGSPCVGDPGSELVRQLHLAQIPVKSLGIHSYVLAAIALSGCDGNRFKFHGYPPKEDRPFLEWLEISKRESGTQVFIETPYRMRKRLQTLTENLNQDYWMSFSENLGEKDESTFAQSVAQWKSLKTVERLSPKPVGVCIFGN